MSRDLASRRVRAEVAPAIRRKFESQLAAQHGLTNLVRTQVSTAYQQMGGCQYRGCNQPSWYWKTDSKILSDARRAIATALINAGVH